MSPTSAHKTLRSPAAGFTLVEVMMSTLITGIVFAAVLSAYIFLGRSLTRLGNADSLEAGVRRTLYYFTQDAAAATAVTTASPSQVVMTLPSGSVSYTYNSSAQTLTRTQGSASLAVMSGITNFTFDFYDGNATEMTPPTAALVHMIDLVATSTRGLAVSGAQSHFKIASPRVMLRNRPYLQ